MNIYFLDEKEEKAILDINNIYEIVEKYNNRHLSSILATKQVTNLIYEYNNIWKLNLFLDDMKNSLKINNKSIENILKKMTTNNTNIIYNHFSRLNSYIYFMRNYKSYMKNNILCTIVKIKRYHKFINYGYIYSVIDTKHNVFFINDIYICIGPNMVSTDGEYRSRFSLISLIKNIEHTFNELWTTVEEYLLKDKNIKFDYSYHIPSHFDINILSELEKNIISSRNSIKLFIIIWLTQCLLLSMNLHILNTDKLYYSNIINDRDMEFFETLKKKFSIDNIKKFYLYSNYYDTPVRQIDITKVISYPIIGQKIIPLSNENKDINITRYTWNELYISLLVSDLLINNICPGVNMTYDWFFINNVDKTIFNNSEVNYVHTKRSIVILTEYVGRTVDSLKNYGNNEKYIKYIAPLFQDENLFNKYIFDILYSLCCLNLRLNVIHGDLHLNNITILRAYKKYIQNIKEFEDKEYDSYTLYIIDNDVFYFKNMGIIGTIIDFSRSFIYKENCDKYSKTMISDRIYLYYQQMFPKFIQDYGILLKQKLKTNLKDIYTIFTSVDLYILSNKLKKSIEYYPKVKKNIAKKINLMYETSYKFILNNMIDYLQDKIDINTIPNVNKLIIYKLFNNIIIDNKPDIGSRINSVFNINNELKYSHSQYEKLPTYYYSDFIQKDNDKKQVKLQNMDNIKNIYKINNTYKFLCY